MSTPGTELTRRANEIAVTAPQGAPDDLGSLRSQFKMAEILYQSGLMPEGISSPAAVFAVVQKGRELGIPPMYALSNISIIEGKPTAGAELMLALIYRDHGGNAMRCVETSNERATYEYKRRDWSKPERFTFSIKDAEMAKLTTKFNWKSYPAAMLRARAISAIARLAFPDSIGGMYTPEELGADVSVDETGEVVSITPIARPEGPSQQIPEPTWDEMARNSEPGQRAMQQQAQRQPETDPWESPEDHATAVDYESTIKKAMEFYDQNDMELLMKAKRELRITTATGKLSPEEKQRCAVWLAEQMGGNTPEPAMEAITAEPDSAGEGSEKF